MNFWKKLKKPIFALAPMADVTDAAFRGIIAKCGAPDVTYTEFVSADGLCSDEGRKRLAHHLVFSEGERPVVAQLFGAKPENFYKAAKMIAELGFDGIDINMGCPDKAINKQGAGASLINNPKLAKEIIAATKRGAGKLPVSVKTRVGFNSDTLARWLPHLLKAEPAAIIVHARTRKEMSRVPARWELVAKAKKIAEKLEKGKTHKTLILGNGDATDLLDAYWKAKESGADGVMLGRAVFGNPWLFSERNRKQAFKMFKAESGGNKRVSGTLCPKVPDTLLFPDERGALSLKKKLAVLLVHTKLYEKLFKGVKNFALMKKHFASYVGGFEGAKSIRTKLMGAESAKDVEKIIKQVR